MSQPPTATRRTSWGLEEIAPGVQRAPLTHVSEEIPGGRPANYRPADKADLGLLQTDVGAARLSFRERRLLNLLYGAGGKQRASVREVATAFGLSAQRVVIYEHAALSKLRRGSSVSRGCDHPRIGIVDDGSVGLCATCGQEFALELAVRAS